MTEYSIRDHADLLARVRTALQASNGTDEAARSRLIAELAGAEHRLTLSPVPWLIEIHIGVIEHSFGLNTYASLNAAALDEEIASFCREFWPEIHDPRDPAGMNDAEIIAAYFAAHETESLTKDRITLAPPDHPAPDAANHFLETGRYGVLSTAHLTTTTAGLLDLWASWPPGDRPIDIAAAVHGWFVPTRPIETARQAEVPEDLRLLIAFGRERGFNYLLIDCDADTVEGLAQHDW